MAEVVSESLSKLSDQDIRSIVAYLKSSPAKPSGEGLASTFPVTSEGQGLYLSNCAGCHQMNGEGLQGKIPALAQNGSVTAAGPDNIIKVVLGGLYANANYGPMPAFAAALSDEQIAAIANYVRASWGNGASPNADPITVARARQTMDIALVSGESGGACPPLADPGSREAAEKMPGSIKGKLQSPELLVVLQSVPSMIQEAKAAAPNASASELTNALTDLYCPAVAARKEASKVSKREQLDRFAQVVYTQLTGGNALGKQAQAQRAQQPAQ
jgi:cytochrome c553